MNSREHRIVAWVEAMLRQCDVLEARLRQIRAFGVHLLDSTLQRRFDL